MQCNNRNDIETNRDSECIRRLTVLEQELLVEEQVLGPVVVVVLLVVPVLVASTPFEEKQPWREQEQRQFQALGMELPLSASLELQ